MSGGHTQFQSDNTDAEYTGQGPIGSSTQSGGGGGGGGVFGGCGRSLGGGGRCRSGEDGQVTGLFKLIIVLYQMILVYNTEEHNVSVFFMFMVFQQNTSEVIENV